MSITGGTITTDGLYTVHTFNSSGDFIVDVAITGEILLVGGGGGAGKVNSASGAGGGGGLVYDSSILFSSNTHSIVVGDGGIGASSYINGLNGNDTTAISLTAKGGGGGAGGTTSVDGVGNTGGSGGGGHYNAGAGGSETQTSQSGDSGTLGFGTNGGKGGPQSDAHGGGGGGGAGVVGSAGTSSVGGNGGNGKQYSISGTSTYYGGGGGGGTQSVSYVAGAGGLGGGGNGNNSGSGVAGSANTGGGGGGGFPHSTGANGGSGVVVIRYLTPVPSYSTDINETMTLSENWDISTNPIFKILSDTLNISDIWNITTNPLIKSFSESIVIDDVWDIHLAFEEAIIPDTVIVSDTWSINISDPVHFPSAIISHNPLVMITNTSPAQLFQIDISNPNSPTWIGYELSGAEYAKDVVYNTDTNEYFVACANGKVVKVDASTPTIQTLINLVDTDDLTKIASLDTFHKIYAGTDDIDGEVITLQDSEISSINTKFTYLINKVQQLNTKFNTIFSESISIDFRVSASVDKIVSTDFRFLYADDPSNPGSPSPTPYEDSLFNLIKRTDFDVKIDNVSVLDLKLNSVIITHEVDNKSTASFILARKHDRLNQTETGVTSVITNNNNITIYIKGVLEFSGKISSIIANSENENVEVVAKGIEKTDNRKIINIPLSSTTEHIHPYHVLLNNPIIDNEYIDPTEENPKYYKGIKASYGDIIVPNNTYSFQNDTALYSILNPEWTIASKIASGEFTFQQGATYFWKAIIVRNLITGESGRYNYIGTSLSSISAELLDILGVGYIKQERNGTRTYEDVDYYETGDEPRKEISIRNGKKFTTNYYEDRDDGLYQVVPESYNYIGQVAFDSVTSTWSVSGDSYLKQVADLEHEKLLTTAGEISPKTSCSLNIALDGYYYYNLSLLTRFNVTNTTTDNIYKNANGFPVSVKTISISSDTLQVSITADNSLSIKELEEIEDRFPDEESDEYLSNEYSYRSFVKTDPAKDTPDYDSWISLFWDSVGQDEGK